MPHLFSKLPKPPPRRYLRRDLDCSRLKELIPIHEELLERKLPTVKAVRKWLDDIKELSVALGEYDSMAYIRKTVNVRDRKAQAAYLHLIQKVQPGLAMYKDKLNRRLLRHPLRRGFPKRWSLMLKSRQNAVDLFREKNIPLERQAEEVVLRYTQLMGSLEVMFEGRKQTLVQMGVYSERTDRDLRQRAWVATARRRFEEKDRIDGIYDRLVRLRARIARNAGFSNFRDYCHRKYDRFDYTPRDCFVFHDAVEEVVLPAVRQFRQRRRREMGLATLKPWDLAVDPLSRPPLRPFRNGAELARKTARIFRRLDGALGRQFEILVRHGLLDLDNRPGKEPSGYQSTLEERQLPFIFMNAVGRDTDIRTLLHEAGHAFHTLATRHESILDYRHAPMEFCEVASMSMELLPNCLKDTFYSDGADLERSMQMQMELTLELLPWIAMIDAFQQWIYTHPAHTHAGRRDVWMQLRRRFADDADWSAHRPFEETLWQRQMHLFGLPFYYIEYGVAQLGALMVWNRARKNPTAALAAYKKALRLGGSVGLKKLFRAAGGRLDFSARSMRPLVDAVTEQLGD